MGMDGLAKLQYILGWCSVAHIALLLVWWLAYWNLRGLVQGVQGWLVPALQDDACFDRLHIGALAYYELMALIFFIAPYLALRFG